MRGRALASSRNALTRPPQTWSGVSLRATRFDDDAGGDDGDDDDGGGGGGGDDDGGYDLHDYSFSDTCLINNLFSKGLDDGVRESL